MAAWNGTAIGISPELREQLAGVAVSALAEYLCERVSLNRGERELRLSFRDGRYDRARVVTTLGSART
jgi:hypothetical protein